MGAPSDSPLTLSLSPGGGGEGKRRGYSKYFGISSIDRMVKIVGAIIPVAW